MFESVIPVLATVAIDFIADREVALSLVEEDMQVVDLRVERFAGGLVDSRVDLHTVTVRLCNDEMVEVPVFQRLDIVGGVALVLEPEHEICGLLLDWGSDMDLYGTGDAGPYYLVARNAETRVRMRGDRGYGVLKRWRLIDGVLTSRSPLAVRADVFHPEGPIVEE